MKIQSSRYLMSKYYCRDGYKQTAEIFKLNNGKELRIYTDYKNGKKETALLYLLDSFGDWIKSKLKYFDSDGKVTKVLKSVRNN